MKKKYKKRLLVVSIIAVLVVLATFLFVSLYDVSDSSANLDPEFSSKIGYDDGVLLGEKVVSVPWWKKLTSFNFVELSSDFPETGDYLCDLRGSYGPFSHVAGGSLNAGSSCGVGEFIVYRSDGGDIPAGEILFDEVWKKTSSDDIPNFKNYYLKPLSFTFYYACYDCAVNIVDDFEHGCLTDDSLECVKSSDSDCDNDYGFESVCLTHIGSNVVDDDDNVPVVEPEEDDEDEQVITIIGDLDKIDDEGNIVLDFLNIDSEEDFKFIDFKNNSGRTIAFLVVMVVILGLVAYLVFGGKKK